MEALPFESLIMSALFQTERTKKLIPQYKQFLEELVYPIELATVTKPFRQSLPALKSIREQAKARKLFAPHLSEHEGGLGLTLVEFAQVSEVLGLSPLGHYIFNCNAPDIGNVCVCDAGVCENVNVHRNQNVVGQMY